ncbi:hypothetical protein [Limnohabitans sp. Rim47]|uniref:hypothetical protein n=1 Tax=Limnohabitans sp. Rim47 TaxID=1100721 RepID=UPI0012DD0829|nr:hypothetical protein [Limnohabitans sp. Rim47]
MNAGIALFVGNKIRISPFGLGMNRLACFLLSFASSLVCAQPRDLLLDFSVVVPPEVDKQQIVQPQLHWLIKPNAPEHCEQIKGHDGFAVWQEGCVFWTRVPATCTIVTTGRTTHSQIGRLFLLCLSAGEPA